MPNHDFGTLEVCRHATPPAFPQFGISREDEQNDLATVHHENAHAYATLFAESPKLLATLQSIMEWTAEENIPAERRLLLIRNAARVAIDAATEDIP